MRLPSEIQFHQDIRLLIYRSLGLIGEKALNSVIRVIEDLEAATQEPFNRFPDTLGTDEVEIFNLMQDPYRAGRHQIQHLLGLADQPRRKHVRRDGRHL